MNRLTRPFRSASILLFAILIGGCVASPSHPGQPAVVTVQPSVDLAEVRDTALDLARELGPEQVLVALDLDNTLLAMQTELGADQWYDWQKSLQEANPCDARLVPDRLAAQGALYHLGAMRPTQPDVVRLIGEIQDAGIPTLLITARGHDFRLPTFRELRRNGLSFRESAPGPEGGELEAYLPDGGSRPVRYEDGAYLLAGQHKGNMLLALLERLDLPHPQAVVFADDKTKNIHAVRESLEGAGIRGELFHYTREQPRVERFDGDTASRDWETLAPALDTILNIMGHHNFDLPPGRVPEGCR